MQGIDCKMISVSAFLNQSRGLVAKLMKTTSARSFSQSPMNAYRVAGLCTSFIRPAFQAQLLLAEGRDNWGPYTPRDPDFSGNARSASIRAAVLARAIDDVRWEPVATDGDVFVSRTKHANGVMSLKAELLIPSVDAGSLAQCLFTDDWIQTVSSPDWNIVTVVEETESQRVVSMSPASPLREELQAHLLRKLGAAQVEEELNWEMEVCFRALSDGRFIVCMWQAKDTDKFSDHPNYWHAWLLKQKGFAVHVTVASFARHTKKVADSIVANKYVNLLHVDEAVRMEWCRTNSPNGDDLFLLHSDLLMRPYPDAPGANRLAWCLLRLGRQVKSDEGREGLTEHAMGVRGSVMHGASSCVLGWMLSIFSCGPKPTNRQRGANYYL